MKSLKKLIPVVALVLALASFSSCNRGMGCPNNFSIDSVVKVVKAVDNVSAIIKD